MQLNAFKIHNHGGITGDDSGPQYGWYTGTAYSVTLGGASANMDTNGTRHHHTIGNDGQSPNETRPANVAVDYIIKF
jgi:hypothetical protein